jgi:hypothetical protein
LRTVDDGRTQKANAFKKIMHSKAISMVKGEGTISKLSELYTISHR